MKKRTVELVTALVASIVGACISFFLFIVYSFRSVIDDSWKAQAYGALVVFLIQILAIVISCCVNKMNNRLYGSAMLTIGIISILFSYDALLFSGVIYIVSGCLAFRSLENTSGEK
ncbi:hypothetical protein [Bacillus arachidis]|uniref:DUF4064 domain-containing protein n=1 Tax=Bacillus arachidis TaxID=2819290 RepID=A0ABS3NUP6_9BACI|nr:hypothetical protein [Bacillus arachidis]MBO1624590.1 hypothetical protein [Bacillus arachidis]